jgi:Eukaryotic aspartyl protease
MISFFLSLKNESKFTFGGYPEELVKPGESIRWYPLIGKRIIYWQVELRDLIVESKSIYSKSTKIAILDSGTSLLTMPSEEY